MRTPEPPDPPPATAEPAGQTRPGGLRGLIEALRAHPTGRIVLRFTVAVLGALVVATGVVLLPLPGPGWAIIFVGIAIWAIEFHWARRLLIFAKSQVARWRAWYTARTWPMRLLLGTALAVLVVAIVLAALWLSAGPALVRLLSDLRH